MGRHSGVALPSLFLFFLFFKKHCRDFSALLLLTYTHWLLGICTETEGWLGRGVSPQRCPFHNCSQSLDCFLLFFLPLSFTHTAMAITACTESITANHCTLQRNKVSKSLILNDWEFVKMCWCGGLKRGPPLFCIAPPA